jgi:hypothetical protein
VRRVGAADCLGSECLCTLDCFGSITLCEPELREAAGGEEPADQLSVITKQKNSELTKVLAGMNSLFLSSFRGV